MKKAAVLSPAPAIHAPWVYRGGQLHAEAVPLQLLAAHQGTPFFCMSAAMLAEQYHALNHALAEAGLTSQICFSLKANPLLAVVKLFANLGAGADIVSGGELSLALAAGIAPQNIVFSGVGKTQAELEAGLAAGIGQFNVESPAELAMLIAAAQKTGIAAPVALRVNPASGAGGHDKITTGRAHDKFGIALSMIPQLYRQAADSHSIKLRGLAVHIGSQIESIAAFDAPFACLAELAQNLRGQGLPIPSLDLGGGLPISYASHPTADYRDSRLTAYARLCARHFAPLECPLLFEPGRFLAGAAGLLATKIILIKPGTPRDFLIVDAAMNDLIRPALYGADHAVWPETRHHRPIKAYDVAGPICESSDILARNVLLPEPEAGEMLVLLAAGAYGSSLASTYNLRPRPPEWLVWRDAHALIRPRREAEEVFSRDALPAWQLPEAASL